MFYEFLLHCEIVELFRSALVEGRAEKEMESRFRKVDSNNTGREW